MNQSQQQKSEVKFLHKDGQGIRVDIGDRTSILVAPKHGFTSVLRAYFKGPDRSKYRDWSYTIVDNILKDLQENVIWVYRPLKNVLYSAHIMVAHNILNYKMFDEGKIKHKYDGMLNMKMNAEHILKQAWGHFANKGLPVDYHFRQDLRLQFPDVWENHWQTKTLTDVEFPFDLPHANKERQELKTIIDTLYPIEDYVDKSTEWYRIQEDVETYLAPR